MNQPVVLHALGVKRLGFAFGATATLLYLGCVFVMLTVPRPAVVAFFNSLLHGWDVEPLMRWDLPWWEAAMGLVEVFLLGWLVGAVFAAFYNLAGRAARRD